MMKNRNLTRAGVLALLAAVLIVLVLFVDVAPIGPEGTSVGLSRLNQAVHEGVGVHLFWYKVTQALGYLSILVAGVFALIGLVQLIRRKSLMKVDAEILALGALFIVVIGLYVLFEIVVVNYRPVVMPGDAHPEASFPSSHTMLVCAVLGGVMMLLPKYVRSAGLRTALSVLCAVLICVMVVGRLLSGVHWFTDIVGGLLISGALLSLFAGYLAAGAER